MLAVKYRPLEQMQDCSPELENSGIFLGMAAMLDPPRPESKMAVLTAKKAGIHPVMVTGDHPVTAFAVAKKLGIWEPGDLVVTGQELDQMTDAELDRKLSSAAVYARVSPEHKIRIVEAWAAPGTDRGYDRRWRKRCPGTEKGRYRCGHGNDGNGSIQGCSFHDPDR